MNDQHDEVARDDLEVIASSEVEIGEDSGEAAGEADDTQNTPLATTEIRVDANGERKYTRRERWLRDLNHAIAEYPDAPTNYVLRGELALETRDYEQAVADFEKAVELASAQVETSDWGFVAQTMQDRASTGLAQARRRLKR